MAELSELHRLENLRTHNGAQSRALSSKSLLAGSGSGHEWICRAGGASHPSSVTKRLTARQQFTVDVKSPGFGSLFMERATYEANLGSRIGSGLRKILKGEAPSGQRFGLSSPRFVRHTL